MLSLLSTRNVPGQRLPVGCVPLPPPLGLTGPTQPLMRNPTLREPRMNEPVSSSRTHGVREDAVEVLEEAREVRGGLRAGDPAHREQRDAVVALGDEEVADGVVVEDLEGARTGGAAGVMTATASATAAAGRGDAEAHRAVGPAREPRARGVNDPRPRQLPSQSSRNCRRGRGLGAAERARIEQRDRVVALGQVERANRVVVQHLEGGRTGGRRRLGAATPGARAKTVRTATTSSRERVLSRMAATIPPRRSGQPPTFPLYQFSLS